MIARLFTKKVGARDKPHLVPIHSRRHILSRFFDRLGWLKGASSLNFFLTLIYKDFLTVLSHFCEVASVRRLYFPEPLLFFCPLRKES